jgi:hypothetical protein
MLFVAILLILLPKKAKVDSIIHYAHFALNFYLYNIIKPIL